MSDILKAFYKSHFQYVCGQLLNGRPGDLIVLDLNSELIDCTLSAALPSKGCFTHQNMNRPFTRSLEHTCSNVASFRHF